MAKSKKTKANKVKPKKAEKKPSKKKLSKEISLRELLEAGCHFGHKKSKNHPKVKPYIYAVRNQISIFDLAKTKEKLLEAKKFVKKLTEKGGKIVFVGTKRQAREVVRKEAKEANMPYVTRRWLGGIITNWEEIKKNNIDKYKKLKKDWDAGKFESRTKKEQSVIKREIVRLERMIGGLINLDELFDAVFVVDVKSEDVAVKEAKTKDIPVIAIVDSNCNPELVDYPIPANDDAAKSIQLIVGELAKAVKN